MRVTSKAILAMNGEILITWTNGEQESDPWHSLVMWGESEYDLAKFFLVAWDTHEMLAGTTYQPTIEDWRGIHEKARRMLAAVILEAAVIPPDESETLAFVAKTAARYGTAATTALLQVKMAAAGN